MIATVDENSNRNNRKYIIDYSVTTVFRQDAYIHQLMLHLDGPEVVRLVVGSPETKYLDRYRDRANIVIIDAPANEWERFRHYNVQHRAAWNYWRSLNLCVGPLERDGLLIFEDDVVTAHGWRRRLGQVISQIESRFGCEYVLNLYCPHHYDPEGKGVHYAFYPAGDFYGTQAVYYPEGIRRRFVDYLQRKGVEINDEPYDYILKAFLKEYGVHLFTTVPSLVQHIGKRTTGLSLIHHRAAYFQKYLCPGINPWKYADFVYRLALRTASRKLGEYRYKRTSRRYGRNSFNQSFRVDGIRRTACRIGRSEVRKHKDMWLQSIRQLQPIEKPTCDSRGIVMYGGGPCYFTCAWVGIQMLRRLGCKLPIELWYLRNELTNGVCEELAKYNVDCRNLNQVTEAKVFGFAAKPFALRHSKFNRILFMDADNICTADPSYLFEQKEFLETGAVFWPDFWRADRKNPIWAVTGCQYVDSPEQDGGQILLDKHRVWRELNLCCHFNANWEFYYQFLYGDKDTFRFAWMALKKPFHMISREPGCCGYINGGERFQGITMVQHDFTDNILFLHRNFLKWDVTRDTDLFWEKICRFKENAKEKSYRLNYFSHKSLELSGDTETMDFKSVFPDLENECMSLLRELREASFFQKYLVECYVRRERG